MVHNRTMEDRNAIQHWIRAWKDAGPRLEAIRRREIRDANNLEVLATLEGAFNHALRTLPPRSSSGLVEMQEWLARLSR
jgi:hypothetical protein